MDTILNISRKRNKPGNCKSWQTTTKKGNKYQKHNHSKSYAKITNFLRYCSIGNLCFRIHSTAKKYN